MKFYVVYIQKIRIKVLLSINLDEKKIILVGDLLQLEAVLTFAQPITQLLSHFYLKIT